MIKGIDNKKVNLSDLEYEYYKTLIKEYGSDSFNDLFDTNKDGIISIIKPTKSVPWVILFFIQNIMINQQLRSNEVRIKELEKTIGRK